MATPDTTVLAPLHPISRRHLAILDDRAGAEPAPQDRRLDDIARTLEVDLLHARTLPWDRVAESIHRNRELLAAAFDPASGRFLSAGADPNLSTARALLALGQLIAAAPDEHVVEQAAELFSNAMKAASRVTSTQAQSLVILGCAHVAQPTALHRDATTLMRALATRLHARFLDGAEFGWPWPEDTVEPESALLPRALIVAGHRFRAETMVGIGLQVLDWLIDVQTAPDGHLSPIGSDGWRYGGERPTVDQQPVDATALLLAAEAAYEATGDPRYRATMERCYAWFLGSNDRGLRVAQPARGASAAGLTATGVNRSVTAESTMTWLIAAEHIRALRAAPPLVMVPMRPGRLARPLQPPMVSAPRA